MHGFWSCTVYAPSTLGSSHTFSYDIVWTTLTLRSTPHIFRRTLRSSNQPQPLKSSVLGLSQHSVPIAYDIHPLLPHSSFTLHGWKKRQSRRRRNNNHHHHHHNHHDDDDPSLKLHTRLMGVGDGEGWLAGGGGEEGGVVGEVRKWRGNHPEEGMCCHRST